MTRSKLQLFGPIRVESDEVNIPRFRSQRTMALLGYLVAEQRTVSRDALAAFFWPDETQSKGRGSLRRELHNLNQILPNCWKMDRQSVQFAPADQTAVDLFRFLEFEQTEQWTEAAGLVRGTFLEGLYLDDNLEFETWLLGERERWRQRAENVLTRVVELQTRQADYLAALDSARKLLQLTPWNEAMHRQVMLLLARTGQREAALKQYALCQATLQAELGVAVSAETTALYERIKRNVPFTEHNLPAPPTPFIGRQEELSHLARWLDDPQVRLITITGLGGMGKTRLALEAATRYHPSLPTEICFIPLASVHSPDALVRSIASGINFQFSGQLEPEVQLLGGLRRRALLLLLDSFEHLLDSAPLVSRILAASTGVRVLVTSRERLNIQGETVFAIQGLDYQAGDGEQSSAVHLFRQTTRRVQPAFKPTLSDISHIEQICRLVEGLPLAIELAASWMDVLPPDHILAEMEDSLSLLKSQSHDRPDRHLSMRAVFAHSWQMLNQAERTTLKKLSVFEGGFDRAAAGQVAGATLFRLSRLVDKSLVSRVGPDRYKMHELLRQFAAERQAANPEEQQQTLNQHCRYYATLLSQYELDSKTDFASISTNLLKTQADFDNVLAAWSRARKAALILEISKLAYFLSLFYEFFGFSREAQATFGDALKCLREQPEQVSPIIQVRVLTHYGWFCHSIYELDWARAALEEAVAQSSALEDTHRADVGLMYVFLGWVTHLQDQSSSARQFLERGLELCQAADYLLGQLISWHMLGEIEYNAGHYPLALKYHQQILTQYPESHFHILLTLGFLSVSYAALKNYVEAANHIHKLLDVLRIFPNMLSGLLALAAIAALYGRKGQVEQAVSYAALALNHPQMGGLARYKAETVLNELRPLVSEELFNDIMEKAAQGRLPNPPLEPDFRLDAEAIDRLEALLEMALED